MMDHLDHMLWMDAQQEVFEQEYLEWVEWCEFIEDTNDER